MTATADITTEEQQLRDAMQSMVDAQDRQEGLAAIHEFEDAVGDLQQSLELEVTIASGAETDLGLIDSRRVDTEGPSKGQLKQGFRMVTYQNVAKADYDLGQLLAQGLTVFDDLYGERWDGLPDGLDEGDVDEEEQPAGDSETQASEATTSTKTKEPARRFSVIKRNAARNFPELEWQESVGEEWGALTRGMPIGAMESWHDALDAFVFYVQRDWQLPDEWMTGGKGSKMLQVKVRYSTDGDMAFDLSAIHYAEDGSAKNLPASSQVPDATMLRLWQTLEAETVKYLDGATAQIDLFDDEWEENRFEAGVAIYEEILTLKAGDAGTPGDDDLFDEADAAREEAAAAASEAEAAKEVEDREDAETAAEEAESAAVGATA